MALSKPSGRQKLGMVLKHAQVRYLIGLVGDIVREDRRYKCWGIG